MRKRNKFKELVTRDPGIVEALRLGGVDPQAVVNRPDWLMDFLIACGERDADFRRSETYKAGMLIATEAAQEQQVADQISKAYWSAIKSGVVTQQQADQYLRDPSALPARLAELQKSNPDWYWSDDGGQAVFAAHNVAVEYEQEVAGDAEPLIGDDPDADAVEEFSTAPPQVQSTASAGTKSIEQQIADGLALMKTNYNEYYSEPHQAKMQALYEQQAGAQEQIAAPVSTEGGTEE